MTSLSLFFFSSRSNVGAFTILNRLSLAPPESWLSRQRFVRAGARSSASTSKKTSHHGLFEGFEPFTSGLSLRARDGRGELIFFWAWRDHRASPTQKFFSLVDTQSLGSATARNPSNDTVDDRSPTGPRAIKTKLGNNTLSRIQRC